MKAHEKLSRELGGQLGPVLAPARREFQAIPEGNLEEPGRREGKQVRPGWQEPDAGEGGDGRVLVALGSLLWRSGQKGGVVSSLPGPGIPRMTDFLLLLGEDKQGCVCVHTYVYVGIHV